MSEKRPRSYSSATRPEELIPINVAYARKAESDAAWDEHNTDIVSDKEAAEAAGKTETDTDSDRVTQPPHGRRVEMNPETRVQTSPEAETPDSPLETEETIADQPDAETRFTDAEILGDHYIVQQMFHELSNQRMQAVEAVQAKLGNLRDTPGKYRLGLKRNIAEARYNRHKKKLDDIEKLPDGLLKRGRMKRLAKAETRFNKAEKAYNDRKVRMNKRTTDVGEHSVQRRDKYIGELKSRREAALAHRSVRREMRKDGSGWLESRRIIKDIPKEHLDRVGKLAGAAAVSKKHEKKATKVEQKSTHREARVLEDITSNKNRVKVYAGETEKAEATVKEIEAKGLPDAEGHLTGLRSQLEQLTDDDPDRTNLTAQVEEAKRTVAIFKEREIPYWTHVAEEGRRNIIRLTEEQARLQDKLTEHQKVSAPASVGAAKARTEAARYATKRDTAINDIKFDKEETKK